MNAYTWYLILFGLAGTLIGSFFCWLSMNERCNTAIDQLSVAQVNLDQAFELMGKMSPPIGRHVTASKYDSLGKMLRVEHDENRSLLEKLKFIEEQIGHSVESVEPRKFILEPIIVMGKRQEPKVKL